MMTEIKDNLLEYLQLKAETFKEPDLDWMVPQLVEHFKSKITSYSYKIYKEHNPLAVKSFTECSQQTLRKATKRFLFEKQFWKTSPERKLGGYLGAALKYKALQETYQLWGTQKTTQIICPGCRDLGNRNFCQESDGLYYCSVCADKVEQLTEDLKKNDSGSLRAELEFHKAFRTHSRAGYSCPDCFKFIPKSNCGKFAISCPYPRCSYSGQIEDLEKMLHPLAVVARNNVVSMNANVKSNDYAIELGALLPVTDDADPSIKIEINEIYEKQLATLKLVVNDQINQVKKYGLRGTYHQKLLMYQAFQTMIEKTPEEMVSYLARKIKGVSDGPIQSRIFQEYIKKIEDALPFTIFKGGEDVEILSISDPRLNLFVGKSVFEAEVNEKGIIPNNTIETYTGSRKFKMFGPCFLGKIIDINDYTTNESYLSKLKSHTFAHIETTLMPGTLVKVTHFRIPAHYELGSLVFLQKIRKNISDKVQYKLYGIKK